MSISTYQRIDFAKEQLDVALELFLSHKSYISSLTLAGAAEEIFGKSLTLQGDKNTLEHEHSIVGPVREWLQHQPYVWKDFIAEKNRVRNAAKHVDDNPKGAITADIEDEALWLIVRAYDNYIRLGLEPTTVMLKFDSWFFENIIGTEY